MKTLMSRQCGVSLRFLSRQSGSESQAMNHSTDRLVGQQYRPQTNHMNWGLKATSQFCSWTRNMT